MFKQYKGLRRELYVLFIGRVMTNLGSMIWPMLTLILNKKIGLNASRVADCLLVFSFIALPFSLLMGKLSDRLNKRNIIIACDIVSVICFLVCALIPISFKSIVLFAIAGLFQTVERPAYDALIADFTLPKDRQRAYSLSYFGVNLGMMLAPTIGGLLFNKYLNIAFLINGLAILTSTCLIFFLIKSVDKEVSAEDSNEYEKELHNDTNALRYVLGAKVLRTYLLFMVIYNIVYSPFSFLMPLELGSVYGDNGSVIYGTLNSMNCVTVVLLTGILTRALLKKAETSKMFIGFISILLGLAVFKIFLIYPLPIYIAIIIFTIGEIILALASAPFASRRMPSNYRGRISSIISVVTSIAVSLFTKVYGYIYDKSGSDSTWLFVFLMGLIGMITVLYLAKVDREEYPGLYK